MLKGVSPSALKELAIWEDRAQKWAWYEHPDTYLRCRECHQGIARMRDRHGTKFDYDESDILALMVAHIRQIHAEAFDAIDQKAT